MQYVYALCLCIMYALIWIFKKQNYHVGAVFVFKKLTNIINEFVHAKDMFHCIVHNGKYIQLGLVGCHFPCKR